MSNAIEIVCNADLSSTNWIAQEYRAHLTVGEMLDTYESNERHAACFNVQFREYHEKEAA